MKEILSEFLFSRKNLAHAVAGATGSVVAMTAFYPLDTVRSRLQLEDRESKNSWKVIEELVREEGIETLYRGILPVLKSLWASNFVFFYSFHGLRYLNRNEAHSAARDLLLGSIAGIINVLTTTPLWVVNTRMKMEGVGNSSVKKYNGLMDGLIKIKKEEGLKALWSGTLPSLMLVSNAAISFMVYESLKRRLIVDNSVGSLTYFLIGALSKTISTALTYPLQLIQAKLRTEELPASMVKAIGIYSGLGYFHGHGYEDLSKNAGMIRLSSYIIKKQGFNGLYKGMEAKLLQTVLCSALMFTTYEKIAALVFRLMRYQRVLPK